jgi:hypothetical protein
MEIHNIKVWASGNIKTITITQDVAGTSYNLKVRRFVPVRGDSLSRRWKTDEEEQSFECAPYAISNMEEAGRTLEQFAEESLKSSICFYIDETDKLLRNTYTMAYRYSIYAEVGYATPVAICMTCTDHGSA